MHAVLQSGHLPGNRNHEASVEGISSSECVRSLALRMRWHVHGHAVAVGGAVGAQLPQRGDDRAPGAVRQRQGCGARVRDVGELLDCLGRRDDFCGELGQLPGVVVEHLDVRDHVQPPSQGRLHHGQGEVRLVAVRVDGIELAEVDPVHVRLDVVLEQGRVLVHEAAPTHALRADGDARRHRLRPRDEDAVLRVDAHLLEVPACPDAPIIIAQPRQPRDFQA
mmetsp:Transcript_123691/g.309136  ORF Transcript_123691/g.309136 Transcript_123691/m.309136 type:complete len:222 (+) Transcript_123691:149-814(+)